MADTAPLSESETSTLTRIEQMLAKSGGAAAAAPEAEPEAEAQDDNATAEGADFEKGAVVEEEPSEAEEEGEEPAEFLTLADFAKKLETDEEGLAKFLRVKDAAGKDVPLADALQAWRAPAPDAAESQRIRARVMELEGAEQTRQGMHSATLEELRAHIAGLAQHLKASEPDLQKLRAENPARFNELRIERMEQERQLERAAQRYEQAQRDRFEAFRVEQAHKLQASVPEWQDPAKFRADLQAIEAYTMKAGFTREEIANTVDHREWLLARKAMLYDQLPTKKEALAKKVANLPKVVTPGRPAQPDRMNQKDFEGAMSELRQTGSAVKALELHLQREETRAAGRKLAAARRRV